jgi:hypothetical protein
VRVEARYVTHCSHYAIQRNDVRASDNVRATTYEHHRARKRSPVLARDYSHPTGWEGWGCLSP